jgi:uncharacterized protein (TIGR03118 family)
MRSHRIMLSVCVALVGSAHAAARGDFYQEKNLVSSVNGLAPHFDPDLQNPWGVSFGNGSPFWVSNQVTGNVTLYNTAGAKQGLVVTIPPGTPGGNPTGQVFNSTASDFVLPVGGKSVFIFDTLNGTIAGWNGASGTTAQIAQTVPGASYTGLALGNNGAGNFLYADNDGQSRIDAFNSAFQLTALGGTFTDPTLPPGFTPYNIRNLGGKLYVSYESNAGGGVVDAFDLNGNFLQRVTANGPGGPLSHPWGLALAPAGFGQFANALLVGNEGDGQINAFDPSNGNFLGTMSLLDTNGNPVSIGFGLWTLTFGGSNNDGDPNTLFFTAGINNETGGLFGSILPLSPEPSAVVLFGLGAIVVCGSRFRKARASARRAA